MAGTTITDLDTGAITSDNDCFVIDTVDGETVKIPYSALITALVEVFVHKSSYNATITQIFNILNGKQNTLTFDGTPTENSDNPCTSGGIYTAESTLQQNVNTTLSGINNQIIDIQSTINGMSSDITSLNSSVANINNNVIPTLQTKITQSAQITIAVTDWANNEATVSYTHDTTKRNIIDVLSTETNIWKTNEVYADSETGTGIIFKCTTTPSVDLHFYVTSMEVAN